MEQEKWELYDLYYYYDNYYHNLSYYSHNNFHLPTGINGYANFSHDINTYFQPQGYWIEYYFNPRLVYFPPPSIYHHEVSLSRRRGIMYISESSAAAATGEHDDFLPLDMLVEILQRLPVKLILRLRTVSKLWNSLTREHHFIKQHLKSTPNPNDLGIIALYQSSEPTLDELSLHYFSNGFHKFDMTDLYEFGEECFQMSNSCNGLICVYGRHTTYVVNPSMKEVLQLPKPRGKAVGVALGQDTSTGEYKVVRLFHGGPNITGCEIFDLGGGGSRWWRRAQDAPCAIHTNDWYGYLPVVVNGAIHWLTHLSAKEETIAISFDIKNETFDQIMPPACFKCRLNARIAELDGCFYLSTVTADQPGYVYLWALEDYRNRQWRKYRIDMSRPGDDSMPYLSIPITIRDGKILWQGSCGRYDYYDLKNKRFLEPKYVHLEYNIGQACAYKESLVSPANGYYVSIF